MIKIKNFPSFLYLCAILKGFPNLVANPHFKMQTSKLWKDYFVIQQHYFHHSSILIYFLLAPATLLDASPPPPAPGSRRSFPAACRAAHHP